jgi:hypothetical protein
MKVSPIPLHQVLGSFDAGKGIVIEPYLRGVSMIRLQDESYERLRSILDAFRDRSLPENEKS